MDAWRNNQSNGAMHNDHINQIEDEVGGPDLEWRMWDLTKVVEEIA